MYSNIHTKKTYFLYTHFQFSSVAQSCPTLQPHELQHARPPCPSPSPGVHSDSLPLSQWCHPAISSSVVPFSSCPQSLPASESFPTSQLFAWGSQSTGVSALASFLPKKSQGWSPSQWTGWISLQSKGLSRVFSNTTVQKHQFSVLSLLHSPTLTSIHDHWKNHSLDSFSILQKWFFTFFRNSVFLTLICLKFNLNFMDQEFSGIFASCKLIFIWLWKL